MTDETLSENPPVREDEHNELNDELIVVGVGASAGGLEAFKTLLTAMPVDSGLTFVLVQHLDPNHESLMADLLARYTSMPVIQVEDGMHIQANHVYIIPPNAYMAISDGELRLNAPTERRGMRMAIDFFLRSLAENRRERAICMILSGTGSDGSLGLKAIKERGGMVMVQEPATAQYDGMPRSAIATGMADYVLPINQIPETLIAYVQHYYYQLGTAPPRTGNESLSDFIDAVLALVRVLTNHDFRPYKRSTLIRRIERRMSLHQIANPRDYLNLIQRNDEEVRALFKDLLISVTNFFRDPQAFAALEKIVLEPLIQTHAPDTPLRIWVPGCATGEEAYSLAIMIFELLLKERKNFPIQIFATDIDENALEIARGGVYPESIAGDLSPEQLQRFFIHENQTYKVSKMLRDAVIFAAHNLTSDPPFSKLDLISCRNLLIYLDSTVQQRIIALFHFALNDEGFLFLGNAETIGPQHGLFAPLTKKWRVYKRLPTTQRYYPDVSPIRGDGNERQRVEAGTNVSRRNSLSALVQQQLLNSYVPVTVLINKRYEVMYIHNPHGNRQPFLQLSSGEPSMSVFAIMRDDMRASVRTAILRVQRELVPITITSQLMQSNQKSHIQVYAVPFTMIDDSEMVLLSFHEVSTAQNNVVESVDKQDLVSGDTIRQLEHELAMTREDLQTTIEELETSNEELKAANEEMMSMNEELQSTNEELETSKEELQSLNEELITVNSQLQDKVIELESASNDLLNLLSSTAIATLFLDNEFCIKRFTPAITNLFNLISSDVGRSIGDIVRKFQDDLLLEDAQYVLKSLHSSTREVKTNQGRWFIRRILPYRTSDNRINGIVITFIEITEMKQIEDALRLSEQRFHSALLHSPITVSHQDRDLCYTWVYNPIGFKINEMIGKTDRDIIKNPEQAQTLIQLKQRVLETGAGVREEIQLTYKELSYFFDTVIEPLRSSDGDISGITCVSTDITTRKQIEAERLQLLERAQAAREEAERAVRLRDTFLSIASHELKTPLTVLLGNTQALQRRLSRDQDLNERDQHAVSLVVSNAMKLNQLINLLLDVSRIERGQLMLNVAQMDLNALVHRIVSETRNDAIQHRLVIEGPEQPLLIQGDSLRLEQTFHNLIGNAIKYSPNRGEVRIALRREDEMICVSISDDGIGIPEQEQEHIFKQFARGSNIEPLSMSGTGIGLYVVHHIVTSHKGTIGVQSKPGLGSTFTVCLPALTATH